MPKRPNEASIQLPLEKNLKTENKQSQTELNHLPNEILAKILGHLSASEIEKSRHVSTRFNEVITTQYHGPCSSDFNNYLNLFTDNKKNTALTYYDYFEEVKKYKEPFLEKQFSEIKVIQENLTDCPGWCNVSPELKEVILKIEEKDINYTEAKRRETLLDDIHVEIIKSKINLQSQNLNLKNLNLTRLPKALFTDSELQEFWQTLTELSLWCNQLTSLPDEIGELRKLRELYLDDNKLISLPPEIGGLQKLKHLSLNHNHLTPEIVGRLGQRFGANFVQRTLETQTYPNIAQTEELSNRNSPRP